MSIDMSTSEQKTNQDITWQDAIDQSESEIRVYQARIKKLRKSLTFFKKKASSGEPFPQTKAHRHKEIS